MPGETYGLRVKMDCRRSIRGGALIAVAPGAMPRREGEWSGVCSVVLGDCCMPMYEYTCEACETKFDHLERSITNPTKPKCPKCGSAKTARALSVFAVGAES